MSISYLGNVFIRSARWVSIKCSLSLTKTENSQKLFLRMVKQWASFCLGFGGRSWAEHQISDHHHSLTLKTVQAVESLPMIVILLSGGRSLDHL